MTPDEPWEDDDTARPLTWDEKIVAVVGLTIWGFISYGTTWAIVTLRW